MADNPLFYQTIVPLNRAAHKDFGLDVSPHPYGFAESTHLIPALVEEFGVASAHLPVVFLPRSGKPSSPVFLVGLRPGRNEFIEAGRWTAGYVPAYLRRYPFMFGEVEGRDPVICIDESYGGLTRDSSRKLFDETGADTPFLKDQISFVTRYYEAAQRSDVLAKQLDDLELLRPIALEAKSATGSSTTLHGVFAVDEAKLNALPPEDFLRLRSAGLLGPIYAHLLSLSTIKNLSPKSEVDGAPA